MTQDTFILYRYSYRHMSRYANKEEVQNFYQNKVSTLNKDRVTDVIRFKTRARYLGLGLGALVLAIYFYTMHAVKQETLDDFDTVV